MAILVKYNGQTISPSPLVSRSFQFSDFGSRWGQTEQIDLSCFLTGLTTPAEAVGRLTGIFPDQFKTLEVYEDSNLVYKWDNLVLQELSFSNSSLPVGGFVPYSAKFLSYSFPSGIIDPSNEYSFTQNEDGTVNVNHKISAKGVRTSNGALDNAVNFVKTFTGKNPYNYCLPTFVPQGLGILVGVQESINRAEATYSVNETYKYNSGSVASYIETTTLDINNSLNQDYTSLDLNIKWKGDSVNGSINNLKTSFSSINLNQTLSSYGINTLNTYQNAFVLSQDSGANTLDIKANFISGNSGGFSGYFDYAVSMDEDLLTQETNWKIEGEFICKGPISFKRNRVNLFKSANQTNSYIPYLFGLITGSALYNSYANFYLTSNSIPNQISIGENTGMATLKLSASFSDKNSCSGLINPKYSIDVEASRWIYELIPAANIEGNYTIQDLQMKNQAKIKLNMDAGSTGSKSNDLNTIYSVLSSISGIYMGDGFIINENISSGLSDIGAEYEFLGHDKVGASLLDSKVYGSISTSYKRPAGFYFGY